MTKDQLIDSVGTPYEIKEEITKNKSKYKYIYKNSHTKANDYITLENDLVVKIINN